MRLGFSRSCSSLCFIYFPTWPIVTIPAWLVPLERGVHINKHVRGNQLEVAGRVLVFNQMLDGTERGAVVMLMPCALGHLSS